MNDEVRVVVVDDVEDAAATLATALQLDGYQVFTAHNGSEALALIEAQYPHCVMLDVDMPGIDGNQLSQMLRGKYGNDMVLIAMSGRDETDVRVAETFERVDFYLRKPFALSELQKALPPLNARPVSP